MRRNKEENQSATHVHEDTRIAPPGRNAMLASGDRIQPVRFRFSSMCELTIAQPERLCHHEHASA